MILNECYSRGASKKSWLFAGVFFALSLLGLVVMNIKPDGGLLPQTVFLFCLIAAVYVLVRYVTNAFVYRVVDEGEDGTFFLAVRVHGKKMLTQCKLPLSSLTVIAKAGTPLPPKTPVSNFSPVFLGEGDTLLYFEGERILARITADEAFVGALRVLAPSAASAFKLPEGNAEATAQRHGPYDLSDVEKTDKDSGENGGSAS